MKTLNVKYYFSKMNVPIITVQPDIFIEILLPHKYLGCSISLPIELKKLKTIQVFI